MTEAALLVGCPKCGAGPGRRCQAIDRARPGPLLIIHSARREALAVVGDQELEALEWM